MRGESLEDNNPENRPESSLLSLTIYKANTNAYQTDKHTIDLNFRSRNEGPRLPFDQSLKLLFSLMT